jgi:hypothetical protein
MAGCSRTKLSILALLLAALGIVATKTGEDDDWRFPCDGQGGWDPAEPLIVHFDREGRLDPDTPGLLDGIRLLDPDGGELQLVLATHDDGLITVCPIGGLEPETTYTWRIGPFHDSYNHLRPPSWAGETETWFNTGPGWPDDPISSQAQCAELPPPSFEGDPCGGSPDTAAGT